MGLCCKELTGTYSLGYGRFLTEKDPLRPDPDPYSITKAEDDRLMGNETSTDKMKLNRILTKSQPVCPCFAPVLSVF